MNTESTGGKMCPFRSVVPTTGAKIGHAVTGISDRECDGQDCMMWTTVGGEEGCALLMAALSFVKQ